MVVEDVDMLMMSRSYCLYRSSAIKEHVLDYVDFVKSSKLIPFLTKRLNEIGSFLTKFLSYQHEF